MPLIGRLLKKLADLDYLTLMSFPGRTGSVIYLNSYLSTMFQASDVMVDKDEVAMSLNIKLHIPEETDAAENIPDDPRVCVSDQLISVSKSQVEHIVRKVVQVLDAPHAGNTAPVGPAPVDSSISSGPPPQENGIILTGADMPTVTSALADTTATADNIPNPDVGIPPTPTAPREETVLAGGEVQSSGVLQTEGQSDSVLRQEGIIQTGGEQVVRSSSEKAHSETVRQGGGAAARVIRLIRPAALYEVLKESQDTRRLANIINRLVNGSAKTFNQQTNVSLDNKYIVLDISELTGDLLIVGMFVALDFMQGGPDSGEGHFHRRVLAAHWGQQQPSGR